VRPRAARYFGGDLTEGGLGGATARLAEPIIADEGQEPNPGVEWAVSLLTGGEVENVAVGDVGHRFIFDLLEAIANGTRLNTHHALLEPTRDALQRLAAADPGNAGWQRDLWVSHRRIADMMERTGHPDEARQWWQQAHDTLLDMKQSGVFASAQDEQSLEQLRAKLGEA